MVTVFEVLFYLSSLQNCKVVSIFEYILENAKKKIIRPKRF